MRLFYPLLALASLAGAADIELSPSGPLKTPQAALEAARAAKKPVRILVADGTYAMTGPLTLGKRGQGTITELRRFHWNVKIRLRRFPRTMTWWGAPSYSLRTRRGIGDGSLDVGLGQNRKSFPDPYFLFPLKSVPFFPDPYFP
jgi:hypothetical protein